MTALEQKDFEQLTANFKDVVLDNQKKADAVREAEIKKMNEALDGHLDAQRKAYMAELDKRDDELRALMGRIGSAAANEGKTPDPERVAEYKAKFASYIRGQDAKTIEQALKALEKDELVKKSFLVSDDTVGGVWVQPDMSGRMVTRIRETSPMRQYCSVQTISSDALTGLNDLNETTATWVGEQTTPADNTDAAMGQWRIPVHQLQVQTKVSETLIEDAAVDVEAYIARKAADKIARTENAVFLTSTGTGSSKPRGILGTPTPVTTDDATRAWGTLQYVGTGTSASFGAAGNGAAKLIILRHKLKSAYAAGAVFMMNRATAAEVRQLTDADGRFVWLDQFQIAAGQMGTLLGAPVVEAQDAPDIGANSFSILFGNFAEAYQIVDRRGMRLLVDPYTAAPLVKYRWNVRVGGDLINSEAVKLLKFI